ncbi:PREDICTED: E3 ubiquitin-protein ligase RNF4 isoform X1 [Ipomoea nil]|uniref:E3 ubiquitin-protein ligase RNF4 isoform X1 n=1 Tax=Ipomoea nil TaxID=35883 RepID=UPI000900F078|nr:PREDICTED: E3 ubiquitin-protein ligase RNF4 isoform X1 [Ipomoea nil]
MSTQEQRAQPHRYTRGFQRRKRLLNVDLNAVPSWEHLDHEGTSAPVVSQDVPPGQRVASLTSETIDIDGLDDDDDVVIISSPRALAEAKNNSMRNRRQTVVVNVDSEEHLSRVPPHNTYKRRRFPTHQSVINLEGYSNSKGDNDPLVAVAPPPPPPKEPTFSCPVCMGPLVEEMSTKCGHIFCKACIKASIAAQGKCPTCRRKITMKGTIRVYLPATS